MRETTGTIRSMRLADSLILFEIDKPDGDTEVVEASDSIGIARALIASCGRVSNIIGKTIRYGVTSGKLQFLALL